MAETTVFVQQNPVMALLRQAGVLVGIAAAVALGAYVVMWARSPHYTMLYSDLSDRDLTQIVELLKSSQVSYRVEPGSNAILVDAGKADDARLQLAGAGLPKGNSRGFEALNEEQAFGTSQFMERARYQHAIEGELSRSISRIENVRGARVHLALPTESVFARSKREPSASVIVDLFGGRTISAEQVAAITHLVSASVPNLPSERVTIVDSRGNLLTEEKAEAGMALTAKRFEYTRKLEQSFQDRISAILSPFVGPDGVRAEVTADLDFTSTEQTRETFNPDVPAVRSERSLAEERTGGGTGGVPGALSNAPPGEATAPEQTGNPANGQANATPAQPGAAQASKSTPSTKRNETTRNYELDRTISHTKPSEGSIRRLSVAVVLRLPAAPPPAKGEKKAQAKAAAPEVDVARMTQLVKDSIGYDAARGDIVSVTTTTFVEPPAPEPLPPPPFWQQPWMWDVAKQVAGGLFVLLLFFGLLRPAMRSLMPKPAPAALPGGGGLNLTDESGGALPAPGGEAMRALPGPGGASIQVPASVHENIDQVKQIVAQDPRVAAQVIREWVGS